MTRSVLSIALTLLALHSSARAQSDLPDGNGSIRAQFRDSDIVISTTSRLAGAIHSLTWNGKEFIDSADHGRQLQSASNFDAGSMFKGETFNPTEAGSRHDGAGDTSTSRLLHYLAKGNQLQTTSQMAFWLRPGEFSDGNPAKNSTELSDHLLTKRVTIGCLDLSSVIQYDVAFGVPIGESHRFAQFEALTGYMPEEFRRFVVFDPVSGQFQPLTDGPGEQKYPIALSTDDGEFAMGVYSPDQPSTGFENAGYGRWRFGPQRVVKWNCVFRLRDASGIAATDYSFRMYAIIGTLEDVRLAMVRLHGSP
ncbi:MAG: hypothetical protein O2856_08685 [Planctomycetota bacterium]|nr:hypothetical protein [Planctomycetota bacterium]